MNLDYVANDRPTITDNPNGNETLMVPDPQYTELFSLIRYVHKLDEEATLRRYLRNHKRISKKKEVRKHWSKIKSTRKEMNDIFNLMGQSEPTTNVFELGSRFLDLRKQNYSAIDELAQLLFGDCEYGGSFSVQKQYYTTNLVIDSMFSEVPTP